MKILYISPYRNISTHCGCSNNIESLKISKHNINLYPVYTDDNTVVPSDDIEAIENKGLSEDDYDLVIQHAPIDYLIPFTGLTKKNYCIPIIKYSKNNISSKYQYLLQFDSILVDSKYDADYISNLLGTKSKKIKLFNYTNYYNNHNKRINLLHHNNYYKLYTFVNDANIHYLNTILLSFLLSLQEVDNCSLIIVAESKDLASKISGILDSIYGQIKMNYMKYHIKVVVLSNSIDDILSIHRSCNCYIEIRPNTNCHFHTFIAKEFHNSFITNENLDLTFEPMLINNEQYGLLYPSASLSLIAEKIKNVIRTQPIHKQDNIPTLDEVI